MGNDDQAATTPGHAAGGLVLEVTDLAVRFGGQVDALRGVSFSMARNDSLAIVGESGSGKSTLASCHSAVVTGWPWLLSQC